MSIIIGAVLSVSLLLQTFAQFYGLIISSVAYKEMYFLLSLQKLKT